MNSPFKFLEAYSKNDKNIFFGREKEVEDIYSRLFASNLLMVYGASGTGKTSLINCGLANRFSEFDALTVNIRRKNNLMQSIREEVVKLAKTPIPETFNLPEAFRSLYLDFFKPVYLIIDQFEELFISGTDEERESCILFLQALLENNYNVKVIIITREEYLAHFSSFEESIPSFFNNRYRVEPMTIAKAEDVIRKTCNQLEIKLEDEKTIPKAILQNISAHKRGVELTYLQVYLDRLFNHHIKKFPVSKQVIFDMSLINEVGTIDDVLALFLEEQVNQLEEQELAWSMLKAFITAGGTKKSTSIEMVQEYLADRKYNIPKEKISYYTQKFLELKIIKYLDE